MKNDTSGRSLEEVVPCLALSNNDSYIISAWGGRVSLFNMVTYKVMECYMPPPAAATFSISSIGFAKTLILLPMSQHCMLITPVQFQMEL